MWILKRRLANSFLWVIFFSIKIKWTSNAIGWFFGGSWIAWSRLNLVFRIPFIVLCRFKLRVGASSHTFPSLTVCQRSRIAVIFGEILERDPDYLSYHVFLDDQCENTCLQGCLLTTSRLCCLSLPNQVYGKHLHLNLTRDRIYVYI